MLATLFLALTISGASADCRACHDGTKAPLMGTGHVVEVDYAKQQAEKPDALRPPNALSGLGSTVAQDMLVDGRIECASCHVPHDTQTDLRYRLRAEILPLCKSCHVLR
jgi:predicted CXXCH cytochrome family protein